MSKEVVFGLKEIPSTAEPLLRCDPGWDYIISAPQLSFCGKSIEGLIV